MTYTEKELDQFLHGIGLSLLSKKSAQHWRYDEETAKEIEWLEALERKVRADKADRKTESDSEKPNNCELQTIRCPKCGRTDYIRDMEKDMGIKGSHYKYKCINCNTYIKDEPTISKMEQVDEPQTCDTCKYGEDKHRYAHICNECGVGINNYEPKDEPQTEDDKKHCVFCKWVYEPNVCGRCRNMNLFADAIEDEPKTQMKTQNSNLTFEKTDEPQTLDDIGKQIQDAYDKGFLSDADAVQAWYEAVKDEPQTDWHYDEQDATWYPYKHEDEPQTDCPWK